MLTGSRKRYVSAAGQRVEFLARSLAFPHRFRMSRTAALLAWSIVLAHEVCAAAAPPVDYHPQVAVAAATRIDWVFPLANQSILQPPKEWLAGYESKGQTYELFAPREYDARRSWPLVLFVSPGGKGMGWRSFEQACRKQGILFAGPHDAGNECPFPRRVRIVLDVLDDVRRQYNIDPERTYIAGFSGGGRIACAVGFALPEYFGGVMPICAAGDLRDEPWLRLRVINRLSVAHVTGDGDFNRGEVERFRGPILTDVGVRSRVWVFPQMGHAVPNGARVEEVLAWLEEGAPARRELAGRYPATRVAGETPPTREQQAQQLLDEAKQRVGDQGTLYSGLMLMLGIVERWPDVPARAEARKILEQYESRAERPWEADDIAEQRKFLIARAKGLDAYASGDLPQQYVKQRASMAEAALSLWKMVLSDGQDAAAVAQARERIPAMEAILAREKPQS